MWFLKLTKPAKYLQLARHCFKRRYLRQSKVHFSLASPKENNCFLSPMTWSLFIFSIWRALFALYNFFCKIVNHPAGLRTIKKTKKQNSLGIRAFKVQIIYHSKTAKDQFLRQPIKHFIQTQSPSVDTLGTDLTAFSTVISQKLQRYQKIWRRWTGARCAPYFFPPHLNVAVKNSHDQLFLPLSLWSDETIRKRLELPPSPGSMFHIICPSLPLTLPPTFSATPQLLFRCITFKNQKTLSPLTKHIHWSLDRIGAEDYSLFHKRMPTNAGSNSGGGDIVP